MTALILWMILSYGTANIVVYGKIFSGFRQTIYDLGNSNIPGASGFRFVSNMVQCIMCFATWMGFFMGLFVYSPVHMILNVHPYASWIFDGFLASGAAWAINAIIEWFEQNRPNNNNNQIL